jgi:hypothetical protein
MIYTNEVLHTTEHAPWAHSASVPPEGEANTNDSLGGIMCLSLGHILSYRNCAMGLFEKHDELLRHFS